MLAPTTPSPVLPKRLLHRSVLDATVRHAARMALHDGTRTLDYATLRERSLAAATYLRNLGVQRCDRVAVFAERSVDTVVTLLAVLLCGAAYVPIDPRWPLSRKRYVLQTIDARAVVMASADTSEAAQYECSARCIAFEDFELARTGQEQEPLVDAAESDIAYILFTSGSSGRPKGVMVSHAAALHFAAWAAERFRIRPEDRIAGFSSFTFDLSVFDVFTTLSSGACLYIFDIKRLMLPTHVARFLERHEITALYTVPTVLMLLEARGGLSRRELRSLRLVLFAGELFPVPAFERLRALLPPRVRYHNLYGPTETNVCAAYALPEDAIAQRVIPIGQAITGVRLVPHRTAEAAHYGPDAYELYVFGATLMSGYWGQAATGFWVIDEETGERGYRTGDVCRRDELSEWVFLGRVDGQLKVNGLRIEASEVESVLLSDPEVAQAAAVVVRRGEAGYARLVAFVVVRAGADSAGLSSRLLERCAQWLPAGAAPSDIYCMQDIPTTSTGKADRSALAAWHASQASLVAESSADD